MRYDELIEKLGVECTVATLRPLLAKAAQKQAPRLRVEDQGQTFVLRVGVG